MIDFLEILRQNMLTDSTITDLVGTRIAAFDMPSGTTLPAIGIVLAGGNTDLDSPQIFPTLEFQIFAKASAECYAIYRVLHDYMIGISNNVQGGYIMRTMQDDERIVSAECQTMGNWIRADEDTPFDYITTTFSVQFMNDEPS